MSYSQIPPVPQPPGVAAASEDERRWGAIAHVGSLAAAWFALGLVGPLLVLLIKGESSAFVRRHAVESLNFQISLLIYLVVATIAAFFTLGLALVVILPVGFVFAVFALIAIIMGTVAANRGQEFRYPLCIRLVG